MEEKKTTPPSPPPAAVVDDAFIKKALLDGHFASPEDIAKAEEYAHGHHTALSEYLFNEELLSRPLLGEAIAEALHTQYLDLSANLPERDLALKIPKEFAQERRVILVKEDKDGVLVATDVPETAVLVADVSKLLGGKKVRACYSFGNAIDQALSLYKEKLSVRFTEILKKEQKMAPEIVGQIIEDAIALKASDIHLEPQEGEVIVRFRIDGVLEDAGSLPKPQYENILNRIKIEARLRIDEHTKAQDGAIRYKKENVHADLRVSIIPTLTGEKVVMRLLGEYLRTLSLAELGLTPEYQAKLTELAERPYGMILTVGPTGSGKTTTLYALLRLLNDTSVNITTIEDPVEYRIPRVNQVQVSEQSGLTFVNGLRTIVRQDPDVILVGEIRDFDTAEIAVNASLTGHLLLSSFHANDAATVIPRLLDMKVEPFLLASTLMVIVAQRLVRKICPHCKVSETISAEILLKQFPKLSPFIKEKEVSTYHGKGCPQCNGSGYRGQIGIFEFITVSAAIQELTLARAPANQIESAARAEGSKSFFEDGLEKVNEGVTTFEELFRVALPPTVLKAPAPPKRAARPAPPAPVIKVDA
ncbi:MAG TPA: GspE/PulE family protein [Candidatus Paceibacterota bacterium]|jgi:type IV pilus assembly protein PilB|nr:GspE/PulE family protein [Candidatus Paceibacterota bacterium]